MFNGTVVARMNEQKQLGLILDSSLSFKKPLNEKIIKAKKNLGIIKHLSTFLPLKAPDIIYQPSVQTQFGVNLTDLIFSLWIFFSKI